MFAIMPKIADAIRIAKVTTGIAKMYPFTCFFLSSNATAIIAGRINPRSRTWTGFITKPTSTAVGGIVPVRSEEKISRSQRNAKSNPLMKRYIAAAVEDGFDGGAYVNWARARKSEVPKIA